MVTVPQCQVQWSDLMCLECSLYLMTAGRHSLVECQCSGDVYVVLVELNMGLPPYVGGMGICIGLVMIT